MPNEVLTNAIDRLADGNSLTEAEAASVLEEIMSGNSSEVQTGAFLVALRTKGETVDEIVGLAKTMRRFSVKVDTGDTLIVDTCGTGGDKSHTFNISTTAAFVVAGAGTSVAKHGNRSATSQCGSADVLEALGANLNISAGKVASCIQKVGIGFMFAPLHHQAMKHVVPVRKELGVRTIFNFLGPLTNPAGAVFQLIGVSNRDYVDLIARALKMLGCKHGLVVHGEDGLDEISISGPSYAAEVYADSDEIRTYAIEPEKLGVNETDDNSMLKGGTAEENAAILKNILAGEEGPRRDIVLINAAAALYVCGVAATLEDGLQLAWQSIDSGAAKQKLKQFISETQAD